MNFSAFYFASGRGSRMSPLTDNVPKPLLPVRDNLSLLDLNLENLLKTGIHKVFITYSYGLDFYQKLVSRYSKVFDIKLIEDVPIMGQGGVLLKNKEILGSDPIIGFNADTFVDVDINSILKLWDENISISILGSSNIGSLPKNVICDRNNEVVGIKTSNKDYFYVGKESPRNVKYFNSIGIFLISMMDVSKVDNPHEFTGIFGEQDLIERILNNTGRALSYDCSITNGFHSMNTIEEYEQIKEKLEEQ